MRVLVTGVAGFIGSHLAERLLHEGHEVVGIDAFLGANTTRGWERNLERLRGRRAFSFHNADLRTADLLPIVADCDALVHEAAVAGLARSWDDLELYASCNLLALGRLLDAVRRVGLQRFVHISTSSVYGRNAVGDETLPTRPTSPYGITKLAAEQLVLAYVEAFGLPAIILRYFSIYGPRQRPDMAYHIFIEAMLDGRPIQIHGDGQQSRSNTFVSDCVDATVLALSGGDTGAIYNIGGNETIALIEAVNMIASLLDLNPRISFLPEQPGDQRATRATTAKARAAFGWKPRVSYAEGLAAQVAWHRVVRREGDVRERTDEQ